MIIVTGAAGFIGSCMASFLNQEGYNNLILVDDFAKKDKNLNWSSLKYIELIDRKDLAAWIPENEKELEFIIHLGARTDTTLLDEDIFNDLNLEYSKTLFKLSTQFQIPFIYASSAATYGDGNFGYTDNEEELDKLSPMNPYGWSKHNFDLWVQKQENKPFFWAGFKFFNVYGPNEYHKGRMASVIFHSFNQINSTGKVKLFKSHRADYEDGGQSRDFIYVKDLISVIYYFMLSRKNSGLYNLGTGRARSFKDLATSVFMALKLPPQIDFIDTPADIRDTYQYFTEANMSKVVKAGYTKPFHTLEEGIKDYVTNYLVPGKTY